MFAFPFATIIKGEAPASKNLTTLAAVKTELGGRVIDDAALNNYIAQESAAIATYCNRDFIAEDLEEHFQIEDAIEALWLSRAPAELTSITVDDAALTLATDVELIADKGHVYRLDANGDWIIWERGGTVRRGRVVVTYTGGWELGVNLPPDLERACIDLVLSRSLAGAGGRDPLLRSEDVPGVGRFDYVTGETASAIRPDVAARVDKYRRPATP